MIRKGLSRNHSEAVVESFAQSSIENIYDRSEIDMTFDERFDKMIRQWREESKIEREHERQERIRYEQIMNERFNASQSELRSTFRWGFGILITVFVSFAGYMIGLMHYMINHLT